MNNTPPHLTEAPLLPFSGALGDLLADARAAHEARSTGQLRGPVTRLPTLDRELSHALAPGLHGIQGNAGTGKSAFALQVGATCGFPALYLSCEMSPAELLRRHTARATDTYLGRLKSGELSVDAIESLTLRALAKAPDLALMDATRAPASPERILECALTTKAEHKSVLVIVDSLQSWAETLTEVKDKEGKPLLFNAGEYETLNAGIKFLRWIAHTLQCPVMFISERNREANRGSGGNGLNSGAGTRKIEYGAETIFDLERDMKEEPDGKGEVEITLRLAKNRHGGINKPIPLQFNGALQRFQEAEKKENGGRYR